MGVKNRYIFLTKSVNTQNLDYIAKRFLVFYKNGLII